MTARILIVDDGPRNRMLFEALMAAEGYVAVSVDNGEDALAEVALQPPDLILLDVMMPGMSGYDVAKSLKADPATANIPLLMVTARVDPATRLAALEAGAQDFLTKPIDQEELWLTVRNLLRQKAHGDLLESELHHLLHYDTLTGLPNRTLFRETLEKVLGLAANKGWSVAVLFLDLDCFKDVNDTLGRLLGDDVLVQFSRRLTGCGSRRDAVGRLGGDEFGLIVAMKAAEQGASTVAGRIRDAVRMPFVVEGREVALTASIGISVSPPDRGDPDVLLKDAETAMYRAKEGGRDTIACFTAEMNTEMQARRDFEAALRLAVINEDLVLHYQPKVHLDSGHISGVEALLRWDRPGHGPVSPAQFIPVLEETGLIVGVGRWVIATVCQQISRWIRSTVGPLPVAVNVAGRQFDDGDFPADVAAALADSGIPAGLLELELTETSLMVNTERTIGILRQLKALGAQISVDDFGTGYSSLAYLRRFPIDKLKIDIAFVRDITSNPEDAAIARTIIRMAHSLKLAVIAEGVETAAQVAYLRRHECDQIQGYHFSQPLPLAELELLLAEAKHLPAPGGSDDGPHKTLLLVDDDVDALDLLRGLLAQDGYRILTALSGAEALELLALHEVQVVVCDQRMPTMNGSQFLDRARSLYPDTLRIILSGYADFDSIIDSINRGAIHRFFKKPWTGQVIREDIREAFRHYDRLHDRSSLPTAAT